MTAHDLRAVRDSLIAGPIDLQITRARSAALAFLFLLAARKAAPQAPVPKPPGAPPSDEIRIRADTQEAVKGHAHYQGFVDLQSGETRIQADDLDYYESDNADGTKNQRMEARGNVVFLRGDERLAGEEMKMDLRTGQGTFTEASGYVQPGVFVEGHIIERLDPNTYRVEDARFTSCAQPNPRWGFTATSAVINVDEKIVARNVLFRVKDVPALYLPYLLYPIRHDQRSTGFLIPHFGYSSLRGFNFGEGFFWAMGRSADQLFYANTFSHFGTGVGHELRYIETAPSRGTFKTYILKPLGGGPLDYDIDWNAIQTFPGKVRATLSVREYSSILFQQNIQDNLNLASSRSSRASLNVQRSFGATNVQLLADANDTYFGDSTYTSRHLPTLRVNRSSQKLGRTGLVFGFEARAEELAYGNQDHVDRYARLDFAPQISRPMANSFLQVTPQIALRYTHYGASLDPDTNEATATGLNRRYLEGTMEVRGPTFSRVFETDSKFYSEKYKHTIGPEVTWRYRTAVETFGVIPKFDGIDQALGTDQLEYALVQRFLAKRPGGPGGKLAPYEFMTWRLFQTYYVQIGNNQNEFDPNFSSDAFGPGGAPAHTSPIQSNLTLRPTPAMNANFNLEYDVNFKQLRSLGLTTGINSPRFTLQAGWSRTNRVAVRVENRVPIADTVRGTTRLQIVPGRLTADGSIDYDILGKTLVQSRARLRYEAQCCGVAVELQQFDYNSRKDHQITFSIELANIGSMGSFMGANQQQGGAFR